MQSHPTWVRGLKLAHFGVKPKNDERSHPTWVRGLKQYIKRNSRANQLSHPTWVRGLKPQKLDCRLKENTVAPYVGAWIETKKCLEKKPPLNVAPYVGAWIET